MNTFGVYYTNHCKVKHLLLYLSLIAVISCKTIEPNRSQKRVERRNERKANKGILDKEMANTMVALADSRLMGISCSKLAQKKAGSEYYTTYASHAMENETFFLKEIKSISKSNNISLPRKIGAENEIKYDELKALSNKSFDKKYRKIEKKRLKEDRKLLNRLSASDDPIIREFATKWSAPVNEWRSNTEGTFVIDQFHWSIRL